MRAKILVIGALILLFAMVSGAQFTAAQEKPASPVAGLNDSTAVCEQMVSQAFADLSNNCAALGPNSVCYGSGQVKATFKGESSSFSRPGDRAALTDLVSLETPAINPETGVYGVAMLNLQANIHSAANQSVTIVIFGEASLQNTVDALAQFIPAEAIDVTIENQAEIRSAPGINAPVMGLAEAGTTLQADALSNDGRWVRVYYQERAMWLARAIVSSDVNTLPVISSNDLTPMQAFDLLTSGLDVPCQGAPQSAVLIQNPTAETVQLYINDVPLQVNSTVFARTVGDNLRLTTGEGHVVLYPEAGELPIASGVTVDIPLDRQGQATGTWRNYGVAVAEINGYAAYENLPSSVLPEPYKGPGIVQASGIGGPEPTIVPPGVPGGEDGVPPVVTGTTPFPQPPLGYGTPGQELEREPWNAFTIGEGVCPTFVIYHSDKTEDWDLYLLDVGPATDLSDSNEGTGADIMPSVSNDAEWVAFTSDRNAAGTWEIYVVGTNDSGLQRVTYNTAVDVNPVWGPGNNLAFESNRDGNWEIYLFDVSGDGEPERLTDDPGNDINPFWAPDGNSIFFQSDRDGDYEIFQLEIETGTLTQITDNDVEDQNPVISHDGDLLIWRQANAFGVYDLWLLDLGTEELTQLTDLGVNVFSQHFSPDDTVVAFHARDAGDFDVHAVEIATLAVKNLTNNEDFQDVAPNFRCSNGNVLYQSDVPGNREIFEVDPQPISGPPNAPIRLTNDPEASDIYPLGDPREEISSRESRVPPRQ